MNGSVSGMENFKEIHATLEYSYDKGHPVNIHTKNEGIHKDCDVASLDCTIDGGVDFVAAYPISGRHYESRVHFSNIEKVVLA